MAEEKKQEKKEKGKLFKDFKAFITKGNVVDMAVGVIIGGAFNAIVTALVNILMSICTWRVPGGIKGLITVLPAANAIQEGIPGIGQKFASSEIVNMTIKFAANQGVAIDKDSATFVQWQNQLLSKYTLHGTTYTYNLSAVIDWGTFINAVISFLIIAVTLFVIVKVAAKMSEKRAQLKAKIEAKVLKEQESEENAEANA